MKKQVNTVDVTRSLVSYKTHRAIARDSNGKLWIVYRQKTATFAEDDIMVAYSTDNGVTWTEEVAVADASSNYTGSHIILIDSSDVPYIIYGYQPTVGNEEIRYSSRSGGSWSSPETVVSNASFILYISACIDSSDNIHIVWSVHSTYNVQYLVGTSGSWGSAEDVDTTGATEESDITIGASDEPYIVFACHTDGTDQGIYLRYRTGGVWQAREQISSVDPSSVVSVVIASDGSNNIHVVWTEDISDDLAIKYRKRTSAVWGTAITVATPSAGEDFNPPILVLDSSGNAYVVYQHKHDASDEATYYKKITSEVAGDKVTLDSTTIRPGVSPSTYAGLWQKYPSSSVLAASLCPVVGLLDETTSYADLYYYAGGVKTIYPSDVMTRGTGLIHRYSAGSFTLELMLGDTQSDFSLIKAELTKEPETAVPKEYEPTPKHIKERVDREVDEWQRLQDLGAEAYRRKYPGQQWYGPMGPPDTGVRQFPGPQVIPPPTPSKLPSITERIEERRREVGVQEPGTGIWGAIRGWLQRISKY